LGSKKKKVWNHNCRIYKMKLFNFFTEKDYHQIFTHLTNEEKEQLYQLAMQLKPKSVIVEIGSYLGASSCFLAMGARKAKSHLYCVDTWQNQEMTEGERDTYSEFIKNTKPLSKYITPLRGWSKDVSQTFNKPVSMIFFDGGHSFETIKTDWNCWHSKLTNDATIVFHDYGWADGVQRIVNEIVKPITTNHNTLPNMWWGTLKK